MARMVIKEWPNKMGWDVGPHEVGWKSNDGMLRVRVYRQGEPWKYGMVLEGTDLLQAVATVKNTGTVIES